jgi:hypothetical protein
VIAWLEVLKSIAIPRPHGVQTAFSAHSPRERPKVPHDVEVLGLPPPLPAISIPIINVPEFGTDHSADGPKLFTLNPYPAYWYSKLQEGGRSFSEMQARITESAERMYDECGISGILRSILWRNLYGCIDKETWFWKLVEAAVLEKLPKKIEFLCPDE